MIEWDEFDSAGGFVKNVEPKMVEPAGNPEFPESLAIEDSTSNGHFFVTGANLEVFEDTGKLLHQQSVAGQRVRRGRQLD